MKVILIRVFTVACVIHGIFWSITAAIAIAAAASDGLVEAAVPAAPKSTTELETLYDEASAEQSRKSTATTADYLAGKLSPEEAKAVEAEIIAGFRLLPRGSRLLDGTLVSEAKAAAREARKHEEAIRADRVAKLRDAARTSPLSITLTILAGALALLVVSAVHILAFKTGLWVLTGRWRLAEALSAAARTRTEPENS